MRYRVTFMARLSLVVACVLALAASLVAGACGGSGSSRTTDPKVSHGSSTTTSTTISYAVPATIDVAYVNKVMAALDHVYGDAIRHLAQTKTVDPRFFDYLGALYSPTELKFQQSSWSREQQQPGFGRLLDVPADPRTTVTRLIQVSSSCLFIAVDRDFGPIYKEPVQKLSNRYIALTPATTPVALNPTGWKMNYDGNERDGSQPSGACVA